MRLPTWVPFWWLPRSNVWGLYRMFRIFRAWGRAGSVRRTIDTAKWALLHQTKGTEK